MVYDGAGVGANEKPIHSWPVGAYDDDFGAPLLGLRQNLLIDGTEQHNGRDSAGRMIDASR